MGLRNFSNFVLSCLLILLLFTLVPITYEIFSGFATLFAVVWMSEWLMETLRKRFLYKRVSAGNKAVFITGCDSGFGHNLAHRMDTLGFRVFAACLNPDGDGAISLKNMCSSRLTVLPLDVTSDQSVRSAQEFVSKNLENDVLWAVVNNAGIPQGGEIDWSPMSDLERVVQVNALGTVRVTKAFLALLRKSKGRLINNTSAVGQFICPGYVGYCMSKSAAIAFSVGLRVEMMKWGVKVISIEPFFYKTNLTRAGASADVIEKAWNKAGPQSTADYGEAYKECFKQHTVRFLRKICSSQIQDVIECFEDAITAVDPLSTYCPAYLPHKVGIKALRALPAVVTEYYQMNELDIQEKPVALLKEREIKCGIKTS